MPTRPAVALPVLRAAAGPPGLVTVRRLVELGVPRRTITRRCAEDGPWTPVLRGVVLLRKGPLTAGERRLAAHLYAGPDSVISGFAAAAAFGLARGPTTERVLVLVDHACHVTGHGFVDVERTTRLPIGQERDGVRCAPVVRAVLDGARGLRSRDDVRAVLAEAVQRRFTTPRLLVEELDAGSSRGAALVRRVLAEVSDGIRSTAEGWARDAVRSAGLPPPRWNPRLLLPDGTVVVPDAYWEDAGLAWQVDSREWHIDPEGWARTLEVRSLLQNAGVLVVSTLPQVLRDEPARIAAEIARMRHLAGSLPPPDVVAAPLGITA